MKSLAHFRCPKFEAHSSLSSLPTVVLIGKKGEVPASLTKALPTHLREHPALRGELGARFVIQGNGTWVVQGIGKQNEFTPQEAVEWGESLGNFLTKEFLHEVQVVFPEGFSEADSMVSFLKGMAFGNFKILGSNPRLRIKLSS